MSETTEEILELFRSVESECPPIPTRRNSSNSSSGKKRPFGIVDPEDADDAPDKRAFQARVVRRLVRQGWFDGATRLNVKCSDEHIANVVLNVHGPEITRSGRLPSRVRGYVFDATWELMVQCVRDARIKLNFQDLPLHVVDDSTTQVVDDDVDDEYVDLVTRFPKRKYRR